MGGGTLDWFRVFNCRPAPAIENPEPYSHLQVSPARRLQCHQCNTVHTHLVVQSPSQVLETFVIEEMLGVAFQPNPQLGNANGPDVGQQVAVPVHKHAAEHGVHHGEHFFFVLVQL